MKNRPGWQSGIWIKQCPECGKEQKYKNEKAYSSAISKNTSCYKCSNSKNLRGFCKDEPWNKGLTKFEDSRLMDISIRQTGENNSFYGKHHTIETIKIIIKYNTGRIHSLESINKMRQSKLENHHLRGKTFEEYYGEEKGTILRQNLAKYAEQFKNSDAGKLERLRFIDYLKNNNPSKNPQVKLKQRKSAIKRIEKNIKNGGQIQPRYNISACQYFNHLMEQTGTHIQHAENGGEFYIKELGYWVDGYDKENNIIYEYDEKYHFNPDGTLKEKDIQRQKEIKEYYPEYTFIRIKFDGTITEITSLNNITK